MMALRDWKKERSYQKEFNYLGGKQHHIIYENKKKGIIIELSHYITPFGSKYSVVGIRHHKWEQGKWKFKQFKTKSQALKFVKEYMKKH